MKLNKYSVPSEQGTTIGSYSSKKSSSSSSSSSSNNKSVGLDREIWGQEDDGGDLNGDLTCEGNMYVLDNWDESEDDEDDDIEGYQGAARKVEPIMPLSVTDDIASRFGNDEGGNHYVKRNLLVDGKGSFKAAEYQSGYNLPADDKSSKFASTEWVKQGHKTLTIKDSKDNQLGTFNNSEDKTITVKNYDDDIADVKNSIPKNVSELDNDSGYITAEDIPDIPEIDKNAPVILFSGIIHSNNGDTSSTNFQPFVVRPLYYSQHTGVEKIELDYLVIDGEKKPTLVVNVVAKEGWTVKATSVHSTVSLDSHCNPLVDFGGNRRSQGYWTTGGVFPTDGKIYLQVWRTVDDNNDSTTNDQIAWSVQEMNLTIFGISYKNS